MKRRQIRKIEYVGEVIRPDKDTSVPTRHEDLYKITVVTPGEGEEERLVSVKDRWFDQPTRVYPDRFNDAMVEQVGEIENVWRSWHMYLEAFDKAHPEVAQEIIQDSLASSTDVEERCVTIKAAFEWFAKQCEGCPARSKMLNRKETMREKDIEELKQWLRDRGYSFRDSEIVKLLRKREDEFGD